MLIVTGIMIALVLVTMVGTTVHVLQIVGWAPITPIDIAPGPHLDGRRGSASSPPGKAILAQFAALIFVVGSYFVAEWSKERSQRRMVAEYVRAEAT